jgi:hypothetical protein
VIEQFRQSVTPILLARDDFINWHDVNAALAGAETGTRHLDEFRAAGDLGVGALTAALGEHPEIYDVALSLIAFNTSGSQLTKWGLSAIVPEDFEGRSFVAAQLLHIGLDRILSSGAPVQDLLRVAEVYKDSFRRRFRSGDRVQIEVGKIVGQSVQAAAARLSSPLRLHPEALADPQLRRSLDYVIATGGRPIAGVATVFQNQSGGRQQRDLSVTYPLLQQKLSEFGMALVLIADGQGLKQASDRTLLQLFEAVSYPMTLKQAESGALEEALVAAGERSPPETIDAAAVARLISGALDARPKITAAELPLAEGPAVLALARYVETHRGLDLQLSSTGDELGWNDPDQVAEARALGNRFDGRRALKLLGNRIGSGETQVHAEGETTRAILVTPDLPPFTGRMLATAHREGLTSDLTRSIGLQALELAPGSSFAILIAERDLSSSEIEAHRKRQAVLPANIIVVGPQFLKDVARTSNPIRVLTNAVLDQSDLTKVSPFILSNATPSRMFYGRDAEAATILGTLGTNSVALLGSRRIGKTSLLRRVKADLEEANFLPFFGDCQTVKNWRDFALLAKSEWGVSTPKEFRPQHLDDVVRKLALGSDKPIVILLDEIDQLLEWDRSHDENSVPEAFFRACRSLSQDGAAQFVFSGERTIAQRIWDPQSPHWNFCRPLPLAQLTREAATSLLIQPLRGMNIGIEDERAFGAEAWRLTSGHPQIVQQLGDRLVRRLDGRTNRRDLSLDLDDMRAVAETYEFAEHYMNTYWGQATPLERRITLVVAEDPKAMAELHSTLRRDLPELDEDELAPALRMLQLYGVIHEEDSRVRLRAEWFREALTYFGEFPSPLLAGALE